MLLLVLKCSGEHCSNPPVVTHEDFVGYTDTALEHFAGIAPGGRETAGTKEEKETS